MTARVAPGDPSGHWLAVVGASGALLVEGAADRADELLRALSTGDPVQPVLDVLAGTGLVDVPDFALIATDAGGRARHAVVRGAVVVRLPDGVELTGEGARTWMEHRVDAASALLVAPGAVDGLALPLERGAVRGARIELAAADADPDEDADAVATVAASAGIEPAPATAPVAVAEHTMVDAEEDGFGYSSLFEATVVRPVEDAAVRPAGEDGHEAPLPGAPTAPEATPSADGDDHDGDDHDGDHDGETILSGSISGRAGRARPEPHELAAVAPERRFALVLPDGRREPLTGELVIGRAPTARVIDGRTPRLVPLDGDPDVSRSHLRVALEGDTVVVTDLRSRNGTSIVLPGKAPQLLRAEEPTPVIPGTVLDLGATQLVVQEDPAEPGA